MKQKFLMYYHEIINLFRENTILNEPSLSIIMHYYYRETIKPIILAIKGTSLTKEEISLFSQHHPLGVVLFRRNIESEIVYDSFGKVEKIIQNKQKLIELVSNIREELGEHAIIAIDQEGGRVRRLTVPTFKMRPPAKDFGDYDNIEIGIELAAQNYYSIATELTEIGINMNFAPVADVRYEGAHDIIGDRSFSHDPGKVIALCKAALLGMQTAGVKGAIKHIPGHGRSEKDSHQELPIVTSSLEELEKTDFRVFKELASHSQFAMTAHIIYKALDNNLPITLSGKAIQYIRDKIGFKGCIISDAIEMRALSENYTLAKIAQLSLKAGVDIILECTGDIKNMQEVLGAIEEVDLEI